MPAAQNEGCQESQLLQTIFTLYYRYIAITWGITCQTTSTAPKIVRIKITETQKYKLRNPTVVYMKLFKISV